MRLRRITAGLVLGVLLAVGGASAAFATPPLDTGGASVVDQANVLSPSDESTVQSAVDRVAADSSTRLVVVFVDTFSDPSNNRDWAAATARSSGLGTGDLIVAVAVKSRQFAFVPSDQYPLSQSDLQNLVNADLKPGLAQSRWADATVSFAKALDSRLQGSGPTSTSRSGSTACARLSRCWES